jgi:hypothetical protein
MSTILSARIDRNLKTIRRVQLNSYFLARREDMLPLDRN